MNILILLQKPDLVRSHMVSETFYFGNIGFNGMNLYVMRTKNYNNALLDVIDLSKSKVAVTVKHICLTTSNTCILEYILKQRSGDLYNIHSSQYLLS